MEQIIKIAHTRITRRKGRNYAPDVHELQNEIDNMYNKLKRNAIVIEASKGKHLDFHTLYDERQAERTETRLKKEGFTTRRLSK